MVLVFLFCFIIFFSFNVNADNVTHVQTDAVIVKDSKTKERGHIITQDDLESMGITTLTDALSLSPSVMVDEGGRRGGTNFKIRGFDSSTIPVIIDGISTQNPYNGFGDNSILTGDLEKITVQKGYSTLLLGSSGMGGAILLTTAKPKKPFELSFKSSLEHDNDFAPASIYNTLSIGSKTSKFYFKNTLQHRDTDHYNLPKSYKAVQGSVQESRKRLFSEGSDIKNTLILGITPINSLDLWIQYTYKDTNDGIVSPEISPVYSLRGWNFDYSHNTSFHGKYNDGKININFLTYFNKYDNSMSDYTSIYHIINNAPYRTSIYDEYAAGFNINAAYNITNQHILKSAFTYRQDNHIGYSKDVLGLEEDINVTENKISLGAEYNYKPLAAVTLSGALGFDSLLPESFYSRDNEFNQSLGLTGYNIVIKNRFLLAGQLGVFYEFMDNNHIYVTYARRNQFPTMNDRYSTQLGESLPNPNLKPEMADHFELGYKGSLFNMLYIETSLYYSMVTDKMVLMEVPNPIRPSAYVNYLTNLDKISLFGYEFLSNIFILEYAELGLNFSVNGYSINKSLAGAKYMPYYPLFTGKAYLKITPCAYFTVTPYIEYNTERYADIFGIEKLSDYFLAHLSFNFYINDYMQIDFSIKNITDNLYETRQNYPLKGRTFTLSFSTKI